MIAAATVYLMVAAPGFWLVETRGLQILYMVVSGFLAGLFVPIWIFPAVAGDGRPGDAVPVDDDVPGRHHLRPRRQSPRPWCCSCVQVAWLVGVGRALGQLLTRAGRRHLEVQGG